MSGQFISEDLLIRSSKEIHKNILPFLKYIIPSCDQGIQDLASFKRFEGRNFKDGGCLGEDEARDNFFKEQMVEDEVRQINKVKLRMQKSKAPNQTMVINVQSHYKKDD